MYLDIFVCTICTPVIHSLSNVLYLESKPLSDYHTIHKIMYQQIRFLFILFQQKGFIERIGSALYCERYMYVYICTYIMHAHRHTNQTSVCGGCGFQSSVESHFLIFKSLPCPVPIPYPYPTQKDTQWWWAQMDDEGSFYISRPHLLVVGDN
jgi:hypothetical protein